MNGPVYSLAHPTHGIGLLDGGEGFGERHSAFFLYREIMPERQLYLSDSLKRAPQVSVSDHLSEYDRFLSARGPKGQLHLALRVFLDTVIADDL